MEQSIISAKGRSAVRIQTYSAGCSGGEDEDVRYGNPRSNRTSGTVRADSLREQDTHAMAKISSPAIRNEFHAPISLANEHNEQYDT